MRLLGVASENRGEDWNALSIQIDDLLSGLGMDLAEEAVYLMFNQAPGSVLNHEGNCLVARSVVGPKKEPFPPFKLVDWVSAPVHRKILKATSWQNVLQESYLEWETRQKQNLKTAPRFILCLKRKLLDALELEILQKRSLVLSVASYSPQNRFFRKPSPSAPE